MHIESIEYHADNGRRVGFLAVDRTRTDRRPGVLIGPEASGISDVVRARARRLAELGYVAFAMDFIGDGRLAEMAEVTAILKTYADAPERIRAIAAASLDILRAQPEVLPGKLAAIGYCFGGTAVLELARAGADVACTVGFHSGLATIRPAAPGAIRGKVLACIGADDPIIPPEQRLAFEAEMRAAKADWRLYVFGNAVHGFSNPEADKHRHPHLAYHPPTEERSFRAKRELFDDTVGAVA